MNNAGLPHSDFMAPAEPAQPAVAGRPVRPDLPYARPSLTALWSTGATVLKEPGTAVAVVHDTGFAYAIGAIASRLP